MSITIKALTELSPWEIASANGLSYTGDINFIPHGGFFYSTSNWIEHGYCSGIEIDCEYDGSGKSIIEDITVNKLSENEFLSALSSWGYTLNDDGTIDTGSGDTIDRTIEIEIEVTKSYLCERNDNVMFDDKDGEPPERDMCRHLKQVLIALQND